MSPRFHRVGLAALIAAAMLSSVPDAQARGRRNSAIWTGVGAAVLGGLAVNALSQRSAQAQPSYQEPFYGPTPYAPSYESGYDAPSYPSYPARRASPVCTVSDGYETVRVPCNQLQIRRY